MVSKWFSADFVMHSPFKQKSLRKMGWWQGLFSSQFFSYAKNINTLLWTNTETVYQQNWKPNWLQKPLCLLLSVEPLSWKIQNVPEMKKSRKKLLLTVLCFCELQHIFCSERHILSEFISGLCHICFIYFHSF